MKCFICNNTCVTIYYCNNRVWKPGDKITHVGKACSMPGCEWTSYPTEVPRVL